MARRRQVRRLPAAATAAAVCPYGHAAAPARPARPPQPHLVHVVAHVQVAHHRLQLLERHAVDELKHKAGGLGVGVPHHLVQRDDVGPARDQPQDFNLALEPLLLDGAHDFDDAPLIAVGVDALEDLAVLALAQLPQHLILVLVAPLDVAHVVPVLLGLLLRRLSVYARHRAQRPLLAQRLWVLLGRHAGGCWRALSTGYGARNAGSRGRRRAALPLCCRRPPAHRRRRCCRCRCRCRCCR
jgi:hypothetical protein